MKIAFIVAYFGDIPWYFRFFNQSCAHNPDVDFILVTDMDVSDQLTGNVRVVRSSLRELSKRCTDTFGFEINIRNPYKICDLRPAFGLVFSDLIKSYDFWGYCDMDLVFGDIRAFITPDILIGHDVVTVKKDYIAGFFSLFRNNDRVNALFRQSKDYRRVFQAELYYNFDECNWEWKALMNGKDISGLDSEITSITKVIRDAERAGDIKVFWRTMDHLPGDISWHRGDLFYKNEKILLCHFIFFKNLDLKYIPRWRDLPGKYFLNSFYFSRHARTSTAGRVLHHALKSVRWMHRTANMLSQYTRWGLSYLFASRGVKIGYARHLQLAGNYRLDKMVINISMTDRRLHAYINGSHYPLLHKSAGKFVVARRKFQKFVNVELDFFPGEDMQADRLQISGSGMWKRTFYKVNGS